MHLLAVALDMTYSLLVRDHLFFPISSGVQRMVVGNCPERSL
jgi:hypothetical protein